MTMPRGASPIRRSELAAAEPFRPEGGEEIFVPSGKFPSPNQELASSPPFRPSGTVPESFIVWPTTIGYWENDAKVDSIWAEEAFAKACADPHVSIPTEVVVSTSAECASSNFAEFMQKRGFQMNGKAYKDGPFSSVDWTNEATLISAIAHVGPVKIGIDSANLASNPQGQVIPGTSGWAIHGLTGGKLENHCACLCGYGPLAQLIDLFEPHGVKVILPPTMPTGLCYAMFIWGSIGIIDQESLTNITGEAWVRNPTTIVMHLD